ncbi:uncharacterized protein BXZ73DRAFT_100214 [Epithele typhae]|uniref:uncharacterized protein n=1 Tax=Epithele typhae TaxID=378194 RepID=UPI0020078419|nr:uncharacterized protein BXZ73DRAFT_100214 [Epithele typhae]KAH9936791.1 hypothetical protein BXZ73DRAFT_100214 [Epithele typhae]
MPLPAVDVDLSAAEAYLGALDLEALARRFQASALALRRPSLPWDVLYHIASQCDSDSTIHALMNTCRYLNEHGVRFLQRAREARVRVMRDLRRLAAFLRAKGQDRWRYLNRLYIRIWRGERFEPKEQLQALLDLLDGSAPALRELTVCRLELYIHYESDDDEDHKARDDTVLDDFLLDGPLWSVYGLGLRCRLDTLRTDAVLFGALSPHVLALRVQGFDVVGDPGFVRAFEPERVPRVQKLELRFVGENVEDTVPQRAVILLNSVEKITGRLSVLKELIMWLNVTSKSLPERNETREDLLPKRKPRG